MVSFERARYRRGAERVTLQQRSPIGTTLIERSMWTPSVMTQIEIVYHLIRCNEKNTVSLLQQSGQRSITWIFHETTSEKKMMYNLQNDWPIIFKIIKVKIKGKFEELPVKEIKVLWQSNATYGCELDFFFLQKNIIGTIVEINWWSKN